ncbi:MAG: hypothetical protein ICV60_03360 [Pyrinomonadaceae bacterium]|nr:hypothetical protein [Pyrinomonadaceae bacterium]
MRIRTSLSVAAITLIAMLALIPISSVIAQVCGSTVVVTPASLNGWTISEVPTQTDVDFVNGPGTPPLGTGSAQLSIASTPGAGDQAAQLRNPNYAGTKLSDLTALSYSTYVQSFGSGGQAPYILLNIDLDNNGTIDDFLFFEPVYQNGTYSTIFGGDTVPDQCAGNPACVSLNTWQTWNALIGGWWSANESAGGPPLITLDKYIEEHPDATIVNSASGGGVRIVAGFGEGAWNGFIGNVDAFTIGVSACNTTYNFEPQIGPPTDANQCKNNGWKTYNTPRAFKNQGDCIQYVNTGK